MTQLITIRRPDDFHLHLRDGDMLTSVAAHSARQFARAMVMPNLKPPVTTLEDGRAYRARIHSSLGTEYDFKPLMANYLCDGTDPQLVRQGFEERVFAAVKLYPAGATTHSEYGVTSIAKITRVLDVMQRLGMPLLLHGESTAPDVDVFDREAVFIDTVLEPLLKDFPSLKVVLEHITTSEAAQFVASDGSGRLAATLTPQHLMFNRNAMFAGGLRPHFYCLPVLKGERHRQALRLAATSGAACFFLGTDSAPHSRVLKESACGCAGIFSAPVALQAYATVFDEEGSLDKFEAFASVNGARFYGLPLNEGTVTLRKEDCDVPEDLAAGEHSSVHPFMGGMQLPWRFGMEPEADSRKMAVPE